LAAAAASYCDEIHLGCGADRLIDRCDLSY
jgi:hypothetical protein